MKDVFQSLVTRLQNEVTEIAHFDLYNSQLENLDEEKVIDYPAVFFEIEVAEFENIAKGSQQATDSLIRVYVVDWKYEDSYAGSNNQTGFLNYFDLLDKVHAALHNWNDPNGAFSTLRRQSLTPDNNHGGLISYIMDYNTTLYDDVADDRQTQQKLNTQPDLDVTQSYSKPNKPGTNYQIP